MTVFDLCVKWALWLYFGAWMGNAKVRTERVEP